MIAYEQFSPNEMRQPNERINSQCLGIEKLVAVTAVHLNPDFARVGIFALPDSGSSHKGRL